MKFILILYVINTWGGGPATAEFADKEACENAGQAIAALGKGHTRRQWVCVPYDLYD